MTESENVQKRGRKASVYDDNNPRSTMTIVLPEKTKRKAKMVAAGRGMTVSDMFASWVENLEIETKGE